MARGWESKSVEEQMASIEQAVPAQAANGFVSEEVRRAAEQERMQRARRLQTLQMQRENILSQRTSNPGRRAALESALAQIESQIQELG
jgi:hypothetical protein